MLELRGRAAHAATAGRPCGLCPKMPTAEKVLLTSKRQRIRCKNVEDVIIPYCPNTPIPVTQLLMNMLFADLVVMAERLHPIPFRTRP
jgi:hypothetical protein